MDERSEGYGQMVNVTEAARLCGFAHRQALYHYLKTGRGPACVVVGGKPYFDPERVREWNRERLKSKKRGKNGPVGAGA